ncbi:hypothetical protein LI328DRAFT_20269 [Trichoderma asperelloides]|nr:hypothetical protein LI328DRAFT_20269 [Trichoderma asperelloides]
MSLDISRRKTSFFLSLCFVQGGCCYCSPSELQYSSDAMRFVVGCSMKSLLEIWFARMMWDIDTLLIFDFHILSLFLFEG